MPNPDDFPFNPNPEVTFPYPVIGSIVRPVGQGCLNCVFRTYCPAVFWYGTWDKRVDDHSGRACTSWSDDPTQRDTAITDDDLSENQYMQDTGVLYGEAWPQRFDAEVWGS